jgi:hypothetical protein
VRGLHNKGGQNNCFVNVIIQSLWALASFRRGLLALPAPAASSSSLCNGAGPSHPAPTAAADVNVLLALQKVFRALAQPLPALAHDPAAAAAASGGAAGDAGWLVSPDDLRVALSALDKGAAAIQIQLSEMHDASEVLGEVLSALHRAEVGRARSAAEDPQLPRRVKVPSDSFLLASHKPSLNGRSAAAVAAAAAGGAHSSSSSSSSSTAAPRSLAHSVFGLDVQVPAPAEDDSSSSSKAGDGSKGRKKNATTAITGSSSSSSTGPASPAAAPTGARRAQDGSTVEAWQYMKFFHLVPAQVGMVPCSINSGWQEQVH